MPIHGSWTHFVQAANDVYIPELDNDTEAEFNHIAKIIGGNVAVNIQKHIDALREFNKLPKPRLYDEINLSNAGFSNTCAVRMSYILNRNHIIIPHILGKTVSGNPLPSSKEPTWNFFRVNDLKEWLLHNVSISPNGQADLIFTHEYDKISPSLEKNKERGIIFFDVHWTDANGHFALYDGTKLVYPQNCYDHCHFDVTRKVLFWKILYP